METRGHQYICDLSAALGREGTQAWVEKTVLAQSEHELSHGRRRLGRDGEKEGRKQKINGRKVGEKK